MRDASRVKAVLFDLDNTLVDLLRVKRIASMACARAMIAAGADLGMDADGAGELLFLHYLEHGIESDDAFSTFLRRNLRNKMSLRENATDRVLAAGVNAYLRTKDNLLTPYPGVPATLVALTRRGYRLGVVTDAPRLKAWQRLWAVSLADFFEVVVTRHDTGRGKPDEAPFRAALEAFSLPPHDVAMVGDWPERDVAGANRLGLFTVLARYGRVGH
jgi:HAD superfamily hydrolase (TIGR01509 family)